VRCCTRCCTELQSESFGNVRPRSADIRQGWRPTHQGEADPRSRAAARATTTSPNDGTPEGHAEVT
jgi:hypothetical protein